MDQQARLLQHSILHELHPSAAARGREGKVPGHGRVPRPKVNGGYLLDDETNARGLSGGQYLFIKTAAQNNRTITVGGELKKCFYSFFEMIFIKTIFIVFLAASYTRIFQEWNCPSGVCISTRERALPRTH